MNASANDALLTLLAIVDQSVDIANLTLILGDYSLYGQQAVQCLDNGGFWYNMSFDELQPRIQAFYEKSYLG
jgi:hypothetical protein